jgi:hypothetical protein
MFQLNTISNWIETFGLQDGLRSLLDLYYIFAITVPISILIYLIFERYRIKLFVDLGNHKWIVKMK